MNHMMLGSKILLQASLRRTSDLLTLVSSHTCLEEFIMKHELTQEEILVEIKDILSEYVEITRPLTPDDRLIDDLGLDSFLIVYFITEIEDRFKIDIPETDFIDLVTVKDLCERIQLEIKKHSTY